MTVDLTTDRAVHVAAFKPTFFAALGHHNTTWFESPYAGYADTSVAPLGIVVHFRAPLAGGEVQVLAIDGKTWTDTDLYVNAFAFAGMVGMEEYGDVGTYTVRQIAMGQPPTPGPFALF